MAKIKKQHKECKVSEADMASLLQRYTASTVLGLLQEVAQFVGGGGGGGAGKIDWEVLAKSTTTGISNPREYQMLWRHLAYRHSFDSLEDGAQLLDDDSDLECEVEAFPNAGDEATAEAAAFVKVLMASGPPNASSHGNGSMMEAPLTINVPCGQSYGPASESSQLSARRGMNITVPVFVPKQPLPGAAAAVVDQLDANGSSDNLLKKKRKHWTKDEDRELTEAVRQFGVGNWATIVRGDFKWERTATQLSQRWAHLRRKKPGVVNLGRDSGTHLSEAQQAARHAMNLALDPPVKNSILNNSGGIGLNTMTSNPVPSSGTIEILTAQHQSSQNPHLTNQQSALDKNITPVKSDLTLDAETNAAGPTGACNKQLDARLPANRTEVLPVQHQSQQLQSIPKPSPVCTLNSVAKLNSTSDKNEALVKSDPNLDVVRAAAVGTGARVANQSNVESPAGRTEALITQHQPLQVPPMTKPSMLPTSASVARPHLTLDRSKSLAKSDLSLDPVRAAAVAAGARIATPSDAASLFKAAQAKNAVHIIATGSTKSSSPVCPPTLSETHPGTRHNSSGPSATPFCTRATGSGKASVVTQPASSPSALPSASLDCTVAGGDTSTTEGMKNSGQDVVQHSQVPGGRVLVSVNGLNEKGKVDAGSEIEEAVLGSQHAASSSNASTKSVILEGNLTHVDGNSAEDSQVADDNEVQVVIAEDGENRSAVVKPEEDQSVTADTLSKGNDGNNGKPEVVSTADVSNGMLKEES